MQRLLELLLRPFVAAVLASVLTVTLLMPQPQSVHEVRTVIQRLPGTNKTIYVTNRSCDTRTIERLLNEVMHSQVKSGDAMTDNGADTTAHGDVATSQSGNARSGNAIVGQQITALAACGSVTINANNHVEDSKAVTGNATVDNDSGISFTPRPTRTHRPRAATTTSPSPTPVISGLTPSPSP